jgi:signal transduction histidine kinase/ActR/RegA family two-component response regulator
MFPELFAKSTSRDSQNPRRLQLRAAQVRLLYENGPTGIIVTTISAPVLAYFESSAAHYKVALLWLIYMLVVSTARLILLGRFRRTAISSAQIPRWSFAFAFGAGLAGAGWGTAGILLYRQADLMNQLFVIFILGGMMLGGASLLASRPEAFLAFLIPTGVLPAMRLLLEGDKAHVTMGLLSLLFTGALVLTTWRFYRTVESSLNLQFENQDLVHDLQFSKSETEALNQQLERRVQERTTELQESTLRLRGEIAQREQMEEELLRVRNLESLGILAGGIAHDFNNFLTVIQGNIELARLELSPEEPVQPILESSANACRRAALLSTQLLTFAKGGAPIRRVASVRKLLLEAVQLARAGASVNITLDIDEDLWPAEVDAGQIGQVLHNILLNAKQAMPEGGTIEVRAGNVVFNGDEEPGSGAHVKISIRDYGPGIPAEILPRIFDPYFTTKRGGSGLGLATAHAIALKHGGHIRVESKGSEGTIFSLVLPASSQTPAPEIPVDARMRSGTGRVLVMDDDEDLRTLLDRALSTLGYEVRSARHGAEAVALYQAAKASGCVFDAVLLDLTITGGMGGLETAAKLKELDPAVKLIVSSGYSDASVMSNFREYGFDEVIPKPWQAAQISEVFRRVLVPNSKGKAVG